jgi:hypothetical protein
MSIGVVVVLSGALVADAMAAVKAPSGPGPAKTPAKGAAKAPGDEAAEAPPADDAAAKPEGDAPAKPAAGAKPAKKGAAEKAPAEPSADDPRVAEIQAQMTAGNLDEALKAAKALLPTIKDKAAKADVVRVIAECQRKKSDWRLAAASYQMLRDCYDKGSDDYVKAGGISEVLKASPKGIYMVGAATGDHSGTNVPDPAKADASKTDPAKTEAVKLDEKGGTLADDQVLEQALARLAGYRATKLKSYTMQIRRKRTPQEVMKAFGPGAEEARQVFLLGPNVPAEDAHELGRVAGQRLAEIAKQIQTTLQAKLQGYAQKQKFENPWSFTNVEKKDVENTGNACKEMAAAEQQFQESLFYVAGSAEWPDADALRNASTERRAAYEQLAEQFQVPEYTVKYGFG